MDYVNCIEEIAPGLDVMEKCDVIEAIMSRVVPEYADAGDDCW